MKFLSDALDVFARTFFAALVGAIAMSAVIDGLDRAFRPYPDDMQMGLLYAFPAGIIFGGVMGLAYALADKEKLSGAAWLCLVVGAPLAILHLLSFIPSSGRFPSAYDVSQSAPGLLWSLFLV